MCALTRPSRVEGSLSVARLRDRDWGAPKFRRSVTSKLGRMHRWTDFQAVVGSLCLSTETCCLGLGACEVDSVGMGPPCNVNWFQKLATISNRHHREALQKGGRGLFFSLHKFARVQGLALL